MVEGTEAACSHFRNSGQISRTSQKFSALLKVLQPAEIPEMVFRHNFEPHPSAAGSGLFFPLKSAPFDFAQGRLSETRALPVKNSAMTMV